MGARLPSSETASVALISRVLLCRVLFNPAIVFRRMVFFPHCCLFLVVFSTTCCSLDALPPSPFLTTCTHLQDCIVCFWNSGYSYGSIIRFLSACYGVNITLRQIKYLINHKYHLRRRGNRSNRRDIGNAINAELNGPGRLMGYRAMTRCLRTKYKLRVSRDAVMNILKEMDPSGVKERKRRKLRRRVYRCPGPNNTWHIDGYDKLSPFGFGISGCIDGYSRRIIFLRVSYSNHDPSIIAGYYMSGVKQLKGCPKRVWSDCGTENGIVAALQQVFHENSTTGGQSYGHRYISSTANQRIEAWWSIFRKSQSNWWLELFKDLKESGSFCNGNIIHVYCLRYYFMNIIQKELDSVAANWNEHRIRKNSTAECPNGIPDELFFLPENSGGTDMLNQLSSEQITWAKTKCIRPSSLSGNDDFDKYADYIVQSHGFAVPVSWQGALKLYFFLKSVAAR